MTDPIRLLAPPKVPVLFTDAAHPALRGRILYVVPLERDRVVANGTAQDPTPEQVRVARLQTPRL